MDQPPQHDPSSADPFPRPDPDLGLDETDPGGLGEFREEEALSPSISDSRGVYRKKSLEDFQEEAALPASTLDSHERYLRWRNSVTSSALVTTSETIAPFKIAARVWARVQSHLPINRRIVAGLAVFGIASGLLFGMSRYDLAPSIKTVSGATYNTALDRLASAASAARDLVGIRSRAPVASEDVASTSPKPVPNVRRATAQRKPLRSSRALELIPLTGAATVEASGLASIGAAGVDATMRAGTLIPQHDDSAVDSSIIYSSTDREITPPVAMRSPGIATGHGDGDQHVLSIEILVNETGGVESVRGRPQPATLGAALQSNLALQVVKTWRFSPARKEGQPVKYRTTVLFVETMNVGRDD